MQSDEGPDPREFMTREKIEEVKKLVKNHLRLDFANLDDMRHEIETYPSKWSLDLDEFDILFRNFHEAKGINEDEFQNLVQILEEKFNTQNQDLHIAETEEEYVPNINKEENDEA